MSSDPEPDHLIVNLHAERTVIEIDQDGYTDWTSWTFLNQKLECWR